MTVTKCLIYKKDDENSDVLAEATVTLDDSLIIHGIRVISGKDGLFVAFPNRGVVRDADGRKKYLDVVHPCSNELRHCIIDEVLRCYKEV